MSFPTQPPPNMNPHKGLQIFLIGIGAVCGLLLLICLSKKARHWCEGNNHDPLPSSPYGTFNESSPTLLESGLLVGPSSSDTKTASKADRSLRRSSSGQISPVHRPK